MALRFYKAYTPGTRNRSVSDSSGLTKTRPEKYHWMIHAERNALSNCVVRPDNGIAYVTGQCCNDCALALHQEGIKKIIMAKSHGTVLFDQKAKERFDLFVSQTGIEIEATKEAKDENLKIENVISHEAMNINPR